MGLSILTLLLQPRRRQALTVMRRGFKEAGSRDPTDRAQVAELVDALASGASGLTAVKVRVLSWAPPSLGGGGHTAPLTQAPSTPGSLGLYIVAGDGSGGAHLEEGCHTPVRGRSAGRRAGGRARGGDRFGDHGPAARPRPAVRGAAFRRPWRGPCRAARPHDL